MPFRHGACAGAIERLLLSRHEKPAKPQLFVLGLPRSGTTLVYQYIVHRLEVSYFTNGVGGYPSAPCLATRIQHKIHGNYSSDFASHYGKVKGPVAPREAGDFWGRFFSLDEYVNYESLSREQVDTLRRTIACIENIFDNVPFVNKNVKHLLRINTLRRIFPDCRFLLVERDRADVALSLLRGRYETLEHPEEWLSARPPDYEELRRLPVIEQVARQLESLHEKIEMDISELGGKNFLRVSYEDFCDRPECLIELLESSVGNIGKRNSAMERFEQSKRKIRNEEEQALVRMIENQVA